MVFLSKILLTFKDVQLPRKYLRSKFIDSVRLHVKGGTGGTGLPKYGGRGGQGGCVYCIGKEDANLKTLLTKYRKSIVGGHGEDSRKTKIVGDPGADKKLEVPLGVTIFGEEGKVFGSINEEDEIVIVARGGPGGDPNNGFLGHSGQNYHIRLDLKLLADVGLVGFPNAGKSSLLHSISKAKPRIASYPFTTIKPNKGIIKYNDLRQISIADLPGLIEGAHNNRGLGHKFLKHLERTKILVLIADIYGFQLSPRHPMRSCLETILLLNKEIELYDPEMLDKPAILVLNKLDLDGAQQTFKELEPILLNINNKVDILPEDLRPKRVIEFQNVIGISALKKWGIDELKQIIRLRLDEYAEMNNPEIQDHNVVLRRNKAMILEKGPIIT